MKLSIVIPVYNESRHIEEVIARVKAVALPTGIEREIIIVDDGSTNGTSDILTCYADDDTVIIRSLLRNYGKGVATRVGIQHASGDIILVQDGDLEYDPNDYPALIQPILAGGTAVVYGSRFSSGGRPEGMNFANWLANRILVLAVNLLFGVRITDEATAYKVFRADVIKGIPLEARRFEFCPEVTAKVLKRGHRIHEVPIHYRARSYDEGKKIAWRDGFVALWTLVKYRFVD